MRKFLLSWISILIVISMMICGCVLSASAEQKTSNRFNVVLVIDASGSMNQTDPNNLRYDATKLFLGLLANDGNYVGSVIFSTGIDKVSNISEIKGMGDKNKVEKDIESIKPDIGDTAIGVALDKAVKMVQSDGNKELPSVIVFLSDGKTDLSGDEKAEKNSNDLKAQAIYDAHKEGIRIFTVGLNSNGGADMAELRQIAKGTNGECQEVKKATDLKEVFAKFYNLIYSTSTTTIFDGDIGSNGRINATFDVPNAGVEEVNIIISSSSSIKNLTLDPPESPKMSVSDVEKISTVSKSFTITKLTSPEGGEWALHAEGKPGDHVKIDMVFNDCLSIATDYNHQDEYYINDILTVKGYLYNYEEKATSGYNDYEAVLHLTYSASDNADEAVTSDIIMDANDDCYSVDIPLKEYGTYTAYMEVIGNGMHKSTEDMEEYRIAVSVGNTPPYVVRADIDEHFDIWPFITKEAEIDISDAVKDKEDATLKYSIINTPFKDSSYQFDGSKITITDFYDLSRGSFSIRATDSLGASVDFDVDVSITNLGIIALIALGAAILIGVIILGILFYIMLNKRFYGVCYMSTFNNETGEYSEEVMRKKIRGRIPLTAFGLPLQGFPMAKSYLYASGKDYVTLKTKKAVYAGGAQVKSFEIDGGGMSNQITLDANGNKGVNIRFESSKKRSVF